MNYSLLGRFLVLVCLTIFVGFAIVAFATPPDPYSQVLATLVLLVVSLPVSYWLVYNRGMLA